MLGEPAAGKWQYSFAASINERLVGYALNCLRGPEDFGDLPFTMSGVGLYFFIVDVHPDFHNAGIGRGLMQRCLDWYDHQASQGTGPVLARIQTRTNNLPMRRVIEQHFGFRLLGQKYYNPNKTDNVYEIDLSANKKIPAGRNS